jgi:4-diphosphocytidyl-2-C-methyl-D-erythritol kinase
MMLSPVVIKAYAKLNLYLDVVGKRSDGYHDIKTVFQSISLHDMLRLIPNPAEVEVVTAHPNMPSQKQNLAYKAAVVFQQETETYRGVSIVLEKNIPIGAGLGGGSADAAATLAGLNLLWGTNLDEEVLLRMAARVGSDVPFCLMGGRAAGSGRGEKLTKLPMGAPLWFVIATPPFSVSTADVYRNLNAPASGPEREKEVSEKFRQVLECLHAGNLKDVLCSVMEQVVLKRYPELKELKRDLQRAGCSAAVMSGSGPTIYGLVSSQDEGTVIVERLRQTRPDHFVALAYTSSSGWEQVTVSTPS